MKIITAICIVIASLVTAPTVDAAHGRCRQYESLLVQYAPRGGWSVSKMSGYMHRESRCTPGVVSTTRDHGLLQINEINFEYLSRKLDVPVADMAVWLKTPANNVRAAALLCSFWRRAGRSCYQPWRT